MAEVEETTHPQESAPATQTEVLVDEIVEYKAQCDKYVTQADKQIDQLTERHKLSGQEFDKQLVAIAGGGLALTITLTKDLLTKDDGGLVWLLYLSWGCFVVCLTVNLFSHRAASNHYNLMIDRLSHIREATSKYQEAQAEYISELTRKIDALTPRINWVNTAALISCIAGVGLFIIFITTNRYLHNDQPGPGAPPAANAAPPTRLNKEPSGDSTKPKSAATTSPAPAGSNPRSAPHASDTSKRVNNSHSKHL
jgi:hypothetical protein